MTIADARSFIGCNVDLSWLDRKGEEQHAQTSVFSADFLPLYGPCLVTDAGDIRLDRIVCCELAAQRRMA